MKLVGARRTGSMAFVIVLVAVVGFCSCLTSQTDSGETEQLSGKLPALFDYKHYLAVFKKDYRSELETTVRKIYFLASAFMVYTEAIAYKFRKSSSYFALNHMSDWSPEELERMKNKVLTNWIESQQTTGHDESAQDDDNQVELEVSSENPEKVAKELEEEIKRGLKAAHLDEALELDEGASIGQRRERSKRDTLQLTSPRRKAPRQLSMNQLIHSPDQAEPVSPKIKLNPKSNNPNYDPLAMEPTTMGLTDQLEPVKFYKRGALVDSWGEWPPNSSIDSLLSPLSNLVIGERGDEGEDEVEDANDSSGPDEMFVDLRESGCLSRARDQGRCGSCYAFAGIALAEYLYCNQTNGLVTFSEQYLVDCGLGRFHKMNGCRGGIPDNIPQFIHNFGLELRSRYPYSGIVSRCPYEEKMDLNKTGFIRMPLERNLAVPMSKWGKQLETSPLYINIIMPRGFSFYGGGIDSGTNCTEANGYHAMLLVGHGREDGQEFWLIRNSYGTSWGEKGYYKLAKSVNESCIDLQAGYVYGTKDGKRFKIKPERNELNRRLQASGE